MFLFNPFFIKKKNNLGQKTQLIKSTKGKKIKISSLIEEKKVTDKLYFLQCNETFCP